MAEPALDLLPLGVSDVRQHVCCPRILYFRLGVRLPRPTTYKMEEGKIEHIHVEELEQTREKGAESNVGLLAKWGVEKRRLPGRSAQLAHGATERQASALYASSHSWRFQSGPARGPRKPPKWT